MIFKKNMKEQGYKIKLKKTEISYIMRMKIKHFSKCEKIQSLLKKNEELINQK